MDTNSKPSPRDFILVVLGQIISVVGSSLLRFALSLYVLDKTGRADIFAFLYAISSIPLLLAPLGGALADRFNRRNLMVIFDLANGAIVLFLILCMQAGNTSIAVIGIVMVLLSIVGSFETPTTSASIPLLVEESKLEGANGIVQAVQALSGVAAPILGGILYRMIGVQQLTVISCAAFFLAAVMEMFIRIPFTKRKQEKDTMLTIMSDIKEGFVYVVKQPFILKAMILAALLNLLLTPYFIVGTPIILRITMQSNEAVFGIGMGLINLAAIIGALTVGIFAKKMSMKKLHRWILAIAVLIIPMALSVSPFMLGLGQYPPFLLFMFCAVAIAAAMTIVSIFVITKVQKKTPNENLGKVMAIITAAAQCAAPVGQFLYGVFFEDFRTKVYLPTMFVSAAMFAVAALSKRILKNEGGEL